MLFVKWTSMVRENAHKKALESHENHFQWSVCTLQFVC